jgi:glyoxylate/hydroxypyruvate reductase A
MDLLFGIADLDPAPWIKRFAHALPEARLRVWQPGDDAPADFAIVWRPHADMLRTPRGLRAIFNLGAGVDPILKLELAHPGTLPPGVPIVRLEDTGMAAQMAEYVSYAVLRYLRRFDEYEQQQAQRVWRLIEPHARETFAVGVMGLGQLGTRVASTLSTFGLPVRGWSRSEKQIEGVASFVGNASLDPFLDGLRMLVNLLPHTPDTHAILNRNTFSRLAPGAYLVNVARGAHLVEADLLDALQSGQLTAATLDVFDSEPLGIEHPFWSEPRITITPHISALTLPDETTAQIVGKMRALERGVPLTGVVDRARAY